MMYLLARTVCEDLLCFVEFWFESEGVEGAYSFCDRSGSNSESCRFLPYGSLHMLDSLTIVQAFVV